jgi:hypothetical protein
MKTALSRLLTALCAAGLLAGGAALRADDVTDQVDEAMKAYKDKDYAMAAQGLEAAATLIRQKRAEGLTQFLPKPLSGWTAEEASSQAAGAAMFGGAVTAERAYRKGEANVTVKFITDSPMMQVMMMWVSNPAMAGSDGGKLERIKSQKAIVKYKAEDKEGEINLVVGGSLLVTINGDDIELADLKAYAEAIDYTALAGAL